MAATGALVPKDKVSAASYCGDVAAGGEERRRTDLNLRRLTTLAALCAVSAIKGADVQLLPSSFRAMEVDLSLKPYALGLLALCQGVACAAAGPFWGNLVDCGLSRTILLVAGSSVWGVCTFALGFASTFTSMAVLRSLNGTAMAMLLPVTQSFVVDLSSKADRGYLFGCLYFFSNMGQVLACLFVTPISNQQVMGMDGWRVALVVVGVLSLMMAMLLPLCVQEEPRAWRPERMGASRELRKLSRFMRIPTFAVIILQGLFGTIPGAALSFTTMYFQYTGISDSMVAMINSLRIIGDACGGLLGGVIGDAMALRSPSYGRALTAQISMVATLPFIYLIFMGLPRSEATAGTYAGLLFLHGLVGSWVAPGCLCPIMCDIIPKRWIASAYAWELALVFCSGNTLGPLLVGGMSQRLFGYRLSRDQVGEMPLEHRVQNAEALGLSLLFTSAVPYGICAMLFTLLYFTYPSDMKAAHDSQLAEGSASSGEEAAGGPSEASQLTGCPDTATVRASVPPVSY